MAVCTTVTVSESEADESTVEITDVSPRSPAPERIEVDVTITNRVISGAGETISPAAGITLNDGPTDFTDTIELGPGESGTITVEYADTPTGEVEVCAEVV